MNEYESKLLELYDMVGNDYNNDDAWKLINDVWNDRYKVCKYNEHHSLNEIFEIRKIALLHKRKISYSDEVNKLFPEGEMLTIPVNKLFPRLDYYESKNKRILNERYYFKLDIKPPEYSEKYCHYYYVRFMYDQVFIVRVSPTLTIRRKVLTRIVKILNKFI